MEIKLESNLDNFEYQYPDAIVLRYTYSRTDWLEEYRINSNKLEMLNALKLKVTINILSVFDEHGTEIDKTLCSKFGIVYM